MRAPAAAVAVATAHDTSWLRSGGERGTTIAGRADRAIDPAHSSHAQRTEPAALAAARESGSPTHELLEARTQRDHALHERDVERAAHRATLSTLSWKITNPLRRTSALVKRLRR